ncbi:MAG: hypothetical protein WBA54_05835 [Acidaminobacteraceae bacterium]
MSYSMTGNNERLAAAVAKKLESTHVQLTEDVERKTGRIIWDILLGRTPKLHSSPEDLLEYDLLILVGPLWMSHPSTPLRSYMKYLRNSSQAYGFATISGGSLNRNPKLEKNLTKFTKRKPRFIEDMYIVDLISKEGSATSKETSQYSITESDVDQLSDQVVTTVRL